MFKKESFRTAEKRSKKSIADPENTEKNTDNVMHKEDTIRVLNLFFMDVKKLKRIYH